VRVRFSAHATNDLQDISDYTAEVWGEDQEVEYIDEIDARLSEIAAGRGQSRPRNDLFGGCQVSPVGRHLIIFMMQDDVIFVSRILHQSMDFPRHVFPLQ
jgi:toxin ParE1/3/4